MTERGKSDSLSQYAMVPLDTHVALMDIFHAARQVVDERPNCYAGTDDFGQALDRLVDAVRKF